MKRSPPDRALKAKLFRGLADSSRLAVLEALRDGSRCVSEVVGTTGLSQPNASAHLACLTECGLITRERRGEVVYYGIADPPGIRGLEAAGALPRDVRAPIYPRPRYQAGPPPAPTAGAGG